VLVFRGWAGGAAAAVPLWASRGSELEHTIKSHSSKT
jgi:hypothetical protein